MKTSLSSLLLLTTALAGSGAYAQTMAAEQQPDPSITQAAPATPEATEAPEEEVEISAPGGSSGEIVVIGRRIPNVIRSTREVVSVLSQGDISRTGEGDIAGALQRVTGLSVVGGRFVYVRGLGERYSLALLNGLPIPSPDPARRVVPLDLFPTSVLASTVVQKSYSANYPGEFGGGVINLTTRAVPEEPFFSVGGSISGNSATTGQLGYVYAGGRRDWTGYDDGTRNLPTGIANAQNNGILLGGGAQTVAELQTITASLANAETTVVQRNNDMPANFSADFSAGKAWDVGDSRFGIILAAGWKNEFQTRAGIQQAAAQAFTGPNGDLIVAPTSSFDTVSTQQRATVNGLIGLGAEFGEHKVRITNVYVHDTLKEARIQSGVDLDGTGNVQLNRSLTAFFERQLIDTQIVGEFKFDNLSLDLRGTYANSKRNSPYERNISYAFDGLANDFTNDLVSPGQSARVAFSRLSENLWGGGADLGYKIEGGPFPIRVTAGYAYTDSQRGSSRFDYRYIPTQALPVAVTQERPDFLLSDYNVYTYGIVLNTTSTIAPVYEAGLTVHGGYGQFEIEPFDGVQFTAGVRYEKANQFVNPIDVFNLNPGQTGRSELNNSYWLPGGTLTWNFAEDMQLRLSASKTIARPQFRELSPQIYFDSDTGRDSFGNQYLIDSQLVNAEARYEYYMGRDERITLGVFYKKITNPIETIAFSSGAALATTYANAPRARLYGAELEVQKYFRLDALSDAPLFASRRFLVSANYTYTDSRISVEAGDTTLQAAGSQAQEVAASVLFRDGQPLTGQSDHIANVQIGFSDEDNLSEQTLLLNYASNRSTQRGTASLPDLVEKPGFTIDLVLRQGLNIAGLDLEAKFEARNLTNVKYQEFQSLNGSRIDNNTYVRGRSFSFGLQANF